MQVRWTRRSQEETAALTLVLGKVDDAYKSGSPEKLYEAASCGALRSGFDHFVKGQIVSFVRDDGVKKFAIVDSYEASTDTYMIRIDDGQQTGPIQSKYIRPTFQIDSTIGSDSRTLLQKSAADGKFSLIVAALELGANPNRSKDARGWTPLHLAVYSDRTRAVAALLAAGADTGVLTMDAKKFSALHFAAQNGYLKVAELLLDHGANPFQKSGSNDGDIPFYVDAKTRPGDTAIGTAVSHGHLDVARAMILHAEILNAQRRTFALLSLKKNSDPFSIVGISGRIWFLILSFLRGRVEHKFVLPKDAKLSERARKALARAAREASALDKARRTNGSRCRLPNECRRWVSKLDLHAEQSILAKSKIDFESASVATAATATEDETAPHSFKIGDRVQCRVAGQWVKDKIGIIVAHHKDNETFDVRLGGDWGGMDLRNKPLSDLRTPRSPRVSSSSRSRTKGGCVLL